jgi:hypothetical protein
MPPLRPRSRGRSKIIVAALLLIGEPVAAPERAGGLRAGQALSVRNIIVRGGRRALVQWARGQFEPRFRAHRAFGRAREDAQSTFPR